MHCQATLGMGLQEPGLGKSSASVLRHALKVWQYFMAFLFRIILVDRDNVKSVYS